MQPLRTPLLAAALLAGLAIAACQSGAPTSGPSPSPSVAGSPAEQELTFKATLSGDQEVPAVSTQATGSGTAVLSADLKKVSFSATVSGLTGPITTAHIHKGEAGTNGDVVKGLLVSGNTLSGVWSATDPSRPLTGADIEDLKAGRLYFNIHTDAHPGGEVRGQLKAQ